MRVFDNYIITIPEGKPRQYKTVRIKDIPEHVYREVLVLGMKQYAYRIGLTKPNYPVPATELDNALAMPYKRVMPVIKFLILRSR